MYVRTYIHVCVTHMNWYTMLPVTVHPSLPYPPLFSSPILSSPPLSSPPLPSPLLACLQESTGELLDVVCECAPQLTHLRLARLTAGQASLARLASREVTIEQ